MATGKDKFDPLNDPVLLRGLTQSRYSRRRFLGRAGLGLAGLSAASLLAACGSDSSESIGTSEDEIAEFWDKQQKTGSFTFGNWPLYIDADPSDKSVHPSLDLFTEETGIKVNYKEAIQAYDEFFAKIQPALAAGQNPGYDLTDESEKFVGKMIEAGWVVPLDHSKLPNFAKYADDKYKNQAVDPGNKYGVPYQSGFVGIGYNPELTGRKIDSFDDLFSTEFERQVGMFGDDQDLPNFTLVGMGIEPEDSTEADWKDAAELLIKQRDDGIVLKYYDQDMIGALARGDIALSMAYSGDIYQANLSGAGLEFVVPKQGGVVWTDNMVILSPTDHALDVITYMDFTYRPDVAAMMAEGISFVSPVPSAKGVVKKNMKNASGQEKVNLQEILDSGLVFPTEEDYSKVHPRRVLSASEEKVWNSIFEPVYQS